MQDFSYFIDLFLICRQFFSSIKLFKTLRSLGIAASGTAKKRSGFPKKLLAFRDVASKKIDWGLQTHMIVDGVLCLSWVDNNPVQFMTTSHLVEDLSKIHYIHVRQQNSIPESSIVLIYLSLIAAHSTFLPFRLPVPAPIHDYNLYMGGSDGNAQQRAYYSSNRRSDRYWWPLFSFLLDAAALNAYILYKLDGSTLSRLSRSEFIRHIATSLLQTPAGNLQVQQPRIIVKTKVAPLVPPPKHHWIHLDKKQYCHPCKSDKTRPSLKRGREPLAEITPNRQKRRKRGSQTMWACGGCKPVKPCCKKPKCWNAIHVKVREVEEMEDMERVEDR